MPLDPNDPEFMAFVKDMKDRPRDDTPRLVLCDWLNDKGHEAYELFIRAMMAVNRIDPGNRLTARGWEFPEERPFPMHGPYHVAFESLKRTWLAWEPVRSLGPHALLWRWHRGTVDELAIDYATWRMEWQQITAFGPVGEVVLTTRPALDATGGISLYSIRLSQAIPGKEHARRRASVAAEAKVWDGTAGNLRWRLRDSALESLLGQVWDRRDVGRFHINDDALNELSAGQPATPLPETW